MSPQRRENIAHYATFDFKAHFAAGINLLCVPISQLPCVPSFSFVWEEPQIKIDSNVFCQILKQGFTAGLRGRPVASELRWKFTLCYDISIYFNIYQTIFERDNMRY
jgi:hypothetical protein